MLKKIFCLLLAAAFVLAFCACAAQPETQKQDDGLKEDATAAPAADATPTPPSTVPDKTQSSAKPAETPDPNEQGAYFIPSEEGAEAFDSVDPDTVLLTFTGSVEVQLTAEQLSGMDIYDYSETTGSDTPVYSGPLVTEVLRMAGAQDASVITVTLGGMTMDFMMSDFDRDTAIFAVIKDGKLVENTSYFICTTTEEFNYILDVSTPYILK